MKAACIVGALCLAAGLAFSQVYECVCSTDVAHATGPSNSHKLGGPSECSGPDTVTLVFQRSDGIYAASTWTSDAGMNLLAWTPPTFIAPGVNPGIDVCGGHRHVVWQAFDTSGGSMDVFYTDLSRPMSPVKVNAPFAESYYPDVCGDDSGCAHIVWEEHSLGRPRVYYRTFFNGTLGDTFLVSDQTADSDFCPAISLFGANDGLCVLWQAHDEQSNSLYIIMRRRCVGGVWQPVENLAQTRLPQRHVSLDCDHGSDGFSGAWEDSSSGKLVAHFEGGNGGGGATPGSSSRPVVSTCGNVWSYLYWEAESSGVHDIYCQSYYEMTGWSLPTSLRQMYGISEAVYAPSCLGDMVVWTQGDSAPYRIMFSGFGYPIMIAEYRNGAGMRPPLLVLPNPVRRLATVNYALGQESQVKLSITDVTGRAAAKLFEGRQQVGRYCVSWNGLDRNGIRVRAGIYFMRLEAGNQVSTQKLVMGSN